MFLHRVEHTAERVDELLVAVGAQMEPGVALDGNLHRRAFQSEHLLTAEFLQHVLLFLQFLVGMAKVTGALAGKTIYDEIELIQSEVANEALGARYLAAKQIPYDLWVVGTHHQLEGAALALLLSLLVVLDIAADEQEDNQSHESTLNEDATEMHGHTNNGAGYESYTSGDKPSTNNTQHTCYTEYGTLTAPGSIGKRRTHCHHEGNVCGRERQLEVGTDGDEHRSKYQVDCSANYVESSTLFEFYGILIETGIDPSFQGIWQILVEPRVCSLTVANNDAGNRRTAKHLIAFILTAQIHGSLDYILRLLRGCHSNNHHETGSEKIDRSGLGTLHQGGHHKAVRCSAVGICHIVIVRRKTS